VKRLIYDHVPVKGHGYEQQHFHITYDVYDEDLSDTTSKVRDLVLSEKVKNHCG
jgi:hypothetical protein